MDKYTGIREVTPEAMQCGIGACPAVFTTEQGKMLIVGKMLQPGEIPAELRNRISQGETLIEVPSELISDIKL